MATIKSSDLDFDEIKQSLKIYLEQQSEFEDYNFEASGLSNILDVLAYNTHINGLVANLATNESFLSSAQLRSSVVSHAETLGYYPRSKTGAQATVNLSINTNVTTVTQIILPKYTTFTVDIDNITYTFRTLETILADNDGQGNFQFVGVNGTNITIFEGELKTKTFIVGELEDDQYYVVPDQNMDTATVTVNVFDTFTSSSFTPYLNVNEVARINQDSTVYILRESPNGYFELTFSDGNILGQRPVSGNKIVVEYLNVKGENANGGVTFRPSEKIRILDTDYDLNVTLVSKSAGGQGKESIQSIKLNAPLKFASQQRLVTSEDYKALILENYSSVIEDVSTWGGQDNVPAKFGSVYVSLKFKDGISEGIQSVTKNSIINNLSNNLSIMSIDTEFKDPVDTFLELTTTFNFDPGASNNSVRTQERLVQALVEEFFEENLEKFEKTFRRSNLLALIDDQSPAILNSRIAVKIQRRFVPSVYNTRDYVLDYPARIALPDDDTHTIISTQFTFGNQPCKIRNELGTTKLQIVNAAEVVLQDNVGSYDPVAGVVNVRGFTPEAFLGEAIKISAIPSNQSTVRPLRNYILTLDTEISFAEGLVDDQSIRIVL